MMIMVWWNSVRVHVICEAAGHKIMFWSFYVKSTRAEVLPAPITCIPTVYFTAKVPKIINISVIAISVKGQRFPARAGSIQAFAETCYGPSLSGDGHSGGLNVTGICERKLIWGCCPSARETIALDNEFVTFLDWASFLIARRCSVLDLTWEPLAFARNVKHLPSWIVADFTGSVLLLPSGGKAVLPICWLWLYPPPPLWAASLSPLIVLWLLWYLQ